MADVFIDSWSGDHVAADEVALKLSDVALLRTNGPDEDIVAETYEESWRWWSRAVGIGRQRIYARELFSSCLDPEVFIDSWPEDHTAHESLIQQRFDAGHFGHEIRMGWHSHLWQQFVASALLVRTTLLRKKLRDPEGFARPVVPPVVAGFGLPSLSDATREMIADVDEDPPECRRGPTRMALICDRCGHALPTFRFQHGRVPKDFKPAPPRCPWCCHPKNRGKIPPRQNDQKKEN